MALRRPRVRIPLGPLFLFKNNQSTSENDIFGRNMRLEELNWMDVEGYLQTEDRILLVTGACEQHAYLSMLTDVRIPMALADAISQETGILVAPPVNFGVSPYFLAYPGTISLRSSTYLNLIEDVIRSLFGAGFRRLLILNGHGGNSVISGRLVELENELQGLQIVWYSWWESHSVTEIALKNELKPYHASWLEAFPFTKVCDLPNEIKNPPYYHGLLNATDTRKIFGDGSFGGAYEASAEIMNEIFYAAYQDVLNFLQFS